MAVRDSRIQRFCTLLGIVSVRERKNVAPSRAEFSRDHLVLRESPYRVTLISTRKLGKLGARLKPNTRIENFGRHRKISRPRAIKFRRDRGETRKPSRSFNLVRVFVSAFRRRSNFVKTSSDRRIRLLTTSRNRIRCFLSLRIALL